MLGLLCFQMLGYGCFNNLIPNLLILNGFQIWSPTPPFFTHYSNSLVVWRFTIQACNRTMQTCHQWGNFFCWFELSKKHEKLFVNNNSVWGWLTMIEMFYERWREGLASMTWKVRWWGIVNWNTCQIELNGGVFNVLSL